MIQSYGGGRFRIGGGVYEGSVLVAREETRLWSVLDPGVITLDSLDPVTAAPGILIVGCGSGFKAPPPDLRSGLKAQGIILEWMDTGAACRTFNVLLTEEREAVAALIAVD